MHHSLPRCYSITLLAAVRLGGRTIGRCCLCSSSPTNPKTKDTSTPRVIARPVDITSVSDRSLDGHIVLRQPPPVGKADDVEWTPEYVEWKKLPFLYLKLSKYKLSALVVLTALSGAVMAPVPCDVSLILWASLGTGLCSASANTFNQWMEVPFDSQMNRTKNRVFVRGLLSPTHGFTFGVIAGLLGTSVLLTQVNVLTAAIGATNILLYTLVYTPLKRITIVNTWIGAVVGSLPPIMGWAACTGSIGSGSLLLAAILYAWQFPHFNSLSWNLRGDYSRAGYQMMAVTNPGLCRRVALRYCLATIPICMLAPCCGLTSWWFAFDSFFVNAFLCYRGWQFYRDPNFQTSRRLFYFTLFHLPLLMAFLFLNKSNPDTKHSDDERTLP